MKARLGAIAFLCGSAAMALPGMGGGTDDPGPPTRADDPSGLTAPPEPFAEPMPPLAPVSAPAPAPATEVDRQLDELTRLERELKKELGELGRMDERARATTIARSRAYVRLARAGLLPVGGGFKELVDHATRVERLHRALGRDVELEKKLAERRIEIGKKLDAVSAKRAPLEVQQRALSQARDALLEAQDRALAFQRAFSSSGVGSHTAVYGAGVGPLDPSEIASGFASMKGRLPFPLPGRAELKSARRPGGGGPGIEMRAPRGTPVRAVYAGRVAFADEYAAYGKTVIVDHGDSFYTVSANLSDIMVKASDEVTTGTRIGSVGDMGRGALLYFEIRRGTDTVDPAEWFGI